MLVSNPLPPETEMGPEWVGDELPPERTFEGENPNNSLTRADTFGIRPDIFEAPMRADVCRQ